MKHRLFVLSDISSLESGVREPDDGQSLIRLLLYSNVIDIEGLVACSNLGHGQVTRPELYHQALDAYEQDWPKLKRHDEAFPSPAALRSLVSAGQPTAGPEVAVEDSIGPDKATAASEALIRAVDREDERPLWVAVWGGTADLAQALWTVREQRSRAELDTFMRKLRVHAIGNQDSTGPWLQAEFPDLFYILRGRGIRGMYRFGDTSLASAAWVQQNVQGHGALGDLYPIYEGGDIWSKQLGKVRGVKEGDTPSYLNLISGDPMRGWGGTFVQTAPNRWTDEAAKDAAPDDPNPYMAGVYRHRAAFQADFAARLDWCK